MDNGHLEVSSNFTINFDVIAPDGQEIRFKTSEFEQL